MKHYTFTHVKGTDTLWFARGLCDSDASIVHDVGTADEAQAAAIARSMQAAYNKGLEMASRMMLEHMMRVLAGRGELSQERHAGGWLVSLPGLVADADATDAQMATSISSVCTPDRRVQLYAVVLSSDGGSVTFAPSRPYIVPHGYAGAVRRRLEQGDDTVFIADMDTLMANDPALSAEDFQDPLRVDGLECPF